MQYKKNSIQVGAHEHSQKKDGWQCAQKSQTIFHQYGKLSRYIGSNSLPFCQFSAFKVLVTWLGALKLG